MAKTLTNTATKVATKLGTEPLIILKIDWGSGDVYYCDKALGNGDGTTEDDAKGIILESSSLNMQMKSTSAAAVNTVDFRLDDSDGSLKTILDTINIYSKDASIYLKYPSIQADLIMQGRIASPSDWSETDRVLSITVETRLRDETIGYAVLGDDVTDPPDNLVGVNWPLCFGTVKKVPAIKINKVPYGTLKSDLIRGSQTIQVEGGDDFPSGEATYIIGGNKVTGSFSGETFTITNYSNSDGGLLDLYTNISCAARVVGDEDEDNKKVAWIADPTLELAGLRCLIGTRWRYCYKQEGAKCYFSYNWNTLLDETDTIDNAGEKGLNAWSVPLTIWGWSYVSGTPIYPDSSTEEVWVCNYFGSDTVYGVFVEQEKDNGDKVLVTVPDDFYTADTSYDSTAHITGGPTCTAIKLVKPLKFYRYPKMGDQLFVNLTSAIPATNGDNTAAQIEYLLNTYTNLTPDSTTFTSVKTAIANYPSNFMTTSRTGALDFIEAMAYQSRCSLIYRNGIAYIKYLSTEPTAIAAITDAEIINGTLNISTTDTYDVVTSLKGKYLEDYDSDDHTNLKELNISSYGLVEEELSFDIYTQAECVEKSMSFYSKRMGNIWRKIKFNTWLATLELDTFDCFTLTLTGDHVSTGSIKCITEDIIHNPDNSTIEITAWTPIVAGTKIASTDAWLDDSGDSKPTISISDETVDYYPVMDMSATEGGVTNIYEGGNYSADDGITIDGTDISVNANTDDFEFDGTTGELKLKSATGTQTRRAIIKSIGTTTLTCKLLDSGGSETGSNLTIYPVQHLGTNDLSGDVWPKFAINDIVSIFQDLNNTWYTTFIFDNTGDCP